MNTQSGKVSKGVLVLLLVVFIGAALGGTGYWLSVRDNLDTSVLEPETATIADTANTSTATEDTVTAYCSEGLTYSNELIGLEFCYPSSWGVATIGEPEASESVSGSGYEISFASKGVVVSSITTDYQNTVGRDGRCEDPENTPPKFSLYSTEWVKDSADSELTAAVRFPLKKDGVYLIQENVNSFFFGLCYSALVNQTGTAYPVVKVALRRELGSVTPLQYTENPEVLLSAAEKAEFLTVVETMRKP